MVRGRIVAGIMSGASRGKLLTDEFNLPMTKINQITIIYENTKT